VSVPVMCLVDVCVVSCGIFCFGSGVFGVKVGCLFWVLHPIENHGFLGDMHNVALVLAFIIFFISRS